MAVSYDLRVNGRVRQVSEAWIGESLLYVLRERLGLPGAKAGCEQGECGSCSVLIDGNVVCACLVLAAAAPGSEITTVEGLAASADGGTGTGVPAMSAVQEALLDAGGVQCGFCTPGLVVAITDLLTSTPSPADIDIREALAGNLCRCTGYGRIIEAVRSLARTPSVLPTPSAGGT